MQLNNHIKHLIYTLVNSGRNSTSSGWNRLETVLVGIGTKMQIPAGIPSKKKEMQRWTIVTATLNYQIYFMSPERLRIFFQISLCFVFTSTALTNQNALLFNQSASACSTSFASFIRIWHFFSNLF